MAINIVALSIDGSDIPRVAHFWADVLGQPLEPGATDAFASIAIRDDLRLMFHQVPEGKVVKNRVHLDLATTDYETETGRLLTLGAVQLHNFDLAQGGSRWRTFADPEGNEFDLVASAA
jgi:predicted enzyme related to lactoylglutathione lyase